MAPGQLPPPVEVEWQFDAIDLRPVDRWLAAAGTAVPAAGAVAVAAGRPRRLVDVYVDTDDWRIGRAGYVLRVRARSGRREATLKDTAPATAGLRRRVEVTEPLTADSLAGLGQGGPVGWRVTALAGTRRLRPVMEIRTRRRPYRLTIDGAPVGELSLDETVIGIGDGVEPARLRRVEVEVDPGAVDAVRSWVQRLQADCGLQPAALSKFEAGLLAAGVRLPGGADLGPTELPEEPTVGELAYVVLRRSVAAMLAHEPGTRLGEDIEELHDMRVATRRLRAALSLFAEALPVRAQGLRAELGWLAAVLGAVRDLDVQLERLEQWQADAEPEDRTPLLELRQVLEDHRDDARRSLLAALESARYQRLVAGLSTMVRQGPSRRSAAGRAPALVVLPELVRGRHLAAGRGARRAQRSGVPADFHRLRIRCKRLRYTLEFTAELYGRPVTAYARRLARLQTMLGELQDAEVAVERLRALAVGAGPPLSPAAVFAMGAVAERYRHEGGELLRGLPARLRMLRGPQWQRLAEVMDRRRAESSTLYAWPPGRRTATPAAPAVAVASAPPGNGRVPGRGGPHPALGPPLAPARPDPPGREPGPAAG